MTQPEQSVQNALKTALEHATPDVLDNILASCHRQEMAETNTGGMITLSENSMVCENNLAGGSIVLSDIQVKKPRSYGKMLGLAAAFFVVLGGFGAFRLAQGNAVAAIVGLDVNPSVELKLNQQEKVLEAAARNDDGVKILADMNLKNTDLNVAMRAILGSMLEQGYVNELANSVLITVEPGDKKADSATGAALERRLAEQAQSILASANVQASVLAQVLDEQDAELTTLAQANNISNGKAKLVQAVAAASPTKTFADLSKLSINDLNLLAASKQANAAQMVVSGTASDKSYVGESAAKTAAFAAAGVTGVTNARVEMDYDDGRMYYEVEFVSGDVKYEVDVDALTGKAGKVERDRADYEDKIKAGIPTNVPAPTNLPSEPKPTAPATKITAVEALAKALAQAGIADKDAFDKDAELDYENGKWVYEVEFQSGATEYKYYLDAATGAVLYHYTEQDDDYKRGGTDAVSSATQKSGSTTQRSSSSNVKTDAVSSATQKISSVPQRSSSSTAKTDAVSSATQKTGSSSLSGTPAVSGGISAAQALTIATQHAGVTNPFDTDVELETKNGSRVFEVDFKSGGLEYEYYISADNGTILRSHSERDD